MKTESKIFGVSVRGYIAFLLILTLCAATITGLVRVNDQQVLIELARLLVMCFCNAIAVALGFYFGQKTKEDDNDKSVVKPSA